MYTEGPNGGELLGCSKYAEDCLIMNGQKKKSLLQICQTNCHLVYKIETFASPSVSAEYMKLNVSIIPLRFVAKKSVLS